ncbi:MAG: hypothetical protein ACRDQ5_26255, partial [Sciscionella sp.]
RRLPRRTPRFGRVVLPAETVMTARAWPRCGMATVQGALGAWQLLLPRSFYDDFPCPATRG